MRASTRSTGSRRDCSPTKSCRCSRSASRRATAAAPTSESPCPSTRFARSGQALLRVTLWVGPSTPLPVVAPLRMTRRDLFQGDAERRVRGPVVAVTGFEDNRRADREDHQQTDYDDAIERGRHAAALRNLTKIEILVVANDHGLKSPSARSRRR